MKMFTSMRISLALAFLAVFPTLFGQKNTVPTERWSNEKIWYSGTFRSEGVYGIRSMKASSPAISRFQSMTPGTSARAITMFSAAVRHGTRVKCW